MLADIFASPRPAASFIPFRDVLLGRTPRVTRLSQGDASTLAEDDAYLFATLLIHLFSEEESSAKRATRS